MNPVQTLVICTTLAVSISACTQPQTETVTASVPLNNSVLHSTGQNNPQARPTNGSHSKNDALITTEVAMAPAKLMRHQAGVRSKVATHGIHYPPPKPVTDRENYLPIEQDSIKQTSVTPVSTFSIDVDTASYSNVRRMLAREGRLPPHDAVRVEEMINYFSYHYDTPDNTQRPFSVNTELAPSPWNAGRKLLQIGLKGYQPTHQQRPPANLVFLIDVSGSMRDHNKLPLVKKSLNLLVNTLDQKDRIALVVYAGAAGLVLDSTPGNQKATIRAAIDQLQAGGSTHGSAGIHLAYQVAAQNLIEEGINRVLIASDGDMNVGTVSITALKELIANKRQSGIALTTLGFGAGNYNYSLMEQLADTGDGNASYIDSLTEAQKVLVKEAQSTLLTIARDVKIQVEFNPAVVAEYRLIGYENRTLRREDFSNDKIDAGDIGAGHTVTAFYELTLSDSAEKRLSPLRYAPPEPLTVDPAELAELAFVKLRYKLPDENTSTEIKQAIATDTLIDTFSAASEDFRFASGVAAFGQLLSGGVYTDNFGYNDALTVMRNARGIDPHGYRSELLSLVELASGLSTFTVHGG